MSEKIDIQTDALKEFLEEIAEQVAAAEALLLAWTGPDAAPDTVDTLFRSFHNIKGTSGMFGLALVQEVFHNAESLLSVIREKRLRPTDDITSLLLESLDEFRKIAGHAVEHGHEPNDKPYGLMAKLVEAKGTLNNLESEAKSGTEEQAKKSEKREVDDSLRISAQNAAELVEIVSSFIQLQNRLEVTLGNDGASSSLRNDIRRFSSRLQGFVLDIRLSPIQPMLSGLQRVAAQVARETGKKFRMQIAGGDTQLDRKVIDLLRDPLIHMVRNAVDHGIEDPEKRIAAKKTPDGLIVIEAFQQSGQVVLSMSDDGKGVPPDIVKNKAVEKGFITRDQANAMSDRDAIALIFLPGFSTAAAITNVSGRGVGMDSVKSSVESIGGTVAIDSELGRGSKITLTLPLTLAIVKSLGFYVGDQMYAVPQTSVEEVITETMATTEKQLATLDDGSRVLHLRRHVVPIISLQRLLRAKPFTSPSVFVVVRYQGERFALQADRITGPLDFVSQPMPGVYKSIDVIGGVNQMNSGEYIALLDLKAVSSMVGSTQKSDSLKEGMTLNADGQEVAVSDIFRSQQKLVFFKSGKHLATAVQAVRQVVQVPASAIDSVGDRPYVNYNGKTYPVLRLSKIFGDGTIQKRDHYTLLLVSREGRHAAIICEDFQGIHRLPREFEVLIKAAGILGSVNHEGLTYLVLNVSAVFAMEFPEQFKSKEGRGNQFNVLIAEDDPFFATSLSDFLKNEGMAVTIAEDGLKAKELLEQTVLPENPAPPYHYVVTDYEMPRMNGLDLLKWIRQHSDLQHIPVTMCTAVGDEVTKRAANKMGVDFFSGKMNYEGILPHIRRRQQGNSIGITNEMLSEVNATAAAEADSDAHKRVLTFRVSGKEYGIEITDLKEISAAGVPTLVPGVSDCVSRMIGFRGHPIPVLNLCNLAGENAIPAAPEQIVARFGDSMCALWVDHVLNVKRLRNMDRATGLPKRDSFGRIGALIGDILWDEDHAVALLNGERVAAFLSFIRDRTDRLQLAHDEGEIAAELPPLKRAA
jgi:two-component system chemotaxis sensor kinase CheA